jgi:TolB-like protein
VTQSVWKDGNKVIAVTFMDGKVAAKSFAEGGDAKVAKGGEANRFDSLAILPFSGEWTEDPNFGNKVSPEKARAFLGVELPDSLAKAIVEKAPAGSLKVIAGNVVRERKSPEQSPQKTGKELNVAAVLAGNVSSKGELALQLIAVESGELLWGDTYRLQANQDGSSMKVFNAQDQLIVQNIIRRLAGQGK